MARRLNLVRVTDRCCIAFVILNDGAVRLIGEERGEPIGRAWRRRRRRLSRPTRAGTRAAPIAIWLCGFPGCVNFEQCATSLEIWPVPALSRCGTNFRL